MPPQNTRSRLDRYQGGGLVTRSGTRTSRVLAEVTRSVRARENSNIAAERERRAEYIRDLRRWRSAASAASGEHPGPPAKDQRLIVSDVAVKTLRQVFVVLLSAGPEKWEDERIGREER